MFMLSDSIGFMLIENGMLYAQNPAYWNLALETEEGQRLYFIATALRTIGRLAFPVFAFLISEGVAHTSNKLRYIMRLVFFAGISEIPFDLATREVLYYPEYQNILFTYALGAMSIAATQKARKLHLAVRLIIIALFCGAAYVIRSDYGAVGVLMISVFFLLREERIARLVVGALIAAVESINYACVSALAFGLIYFYNGRRGEMPLKYFFYIAYPAHMLLFWALVYFANR